MFSKIQPKIKTLDSTGLQPRRLTTLLGNHQSYRQFKYLNQLTVRLTVKLIVKLMVEHQKQPLTRLKSKPEQHGWTPCRSATPPTLWAAHFVPLNASLRLPARQDSSPTVPSLDPRKKAATFTLCLPLV